MVDIGFWVKVYANEWIISPSRGILTLRLAGEPVAEFNRWLCVRWADLTAAKLEEAD
jgi:hypothetical protein